MQEKETRYELPNGAVIYAEIGVPKKGTVQGQIPVEELHWEHLFNDELNIMFSSYMSSADRNMFFLDEDGDVGMWITIRNSQTKEEYTGVLYRECVGTLMVIIYIMMQCMRFCDMYDQKYTFVTDEGVSVLYRRFCELVDEESEPEMRRSFMHFGGYAEAIMRSVAECPEDVFEIIDENIE